MKYDRLTDSLGLIVNEHLSRVATINQALLFPESAEGKNVAYDNASLKEFSENKRVRESLSDEEALIRLDEISVAITRMSQLILSEKNSNKLSLSNYKEFQNLANEFVSRLRRFEHELSREESGTDTLTGLRSSAILNYDLTRELSACERRGDYLGIVMGKVDNYDVLKAKLQKQNMFDIVIFVSDVIKRNMRLYDDGYRFREDTFIISLKHTDQLGSVAATERFAKMLREAHDTPIGRQIEALAQQEISLSYSICKLEVGTDIRDLLTSLESDIDSNADNKSTILEYNDMSAIERFAKGIEK